MSKLQSLFEAETDWQEGLSKMLRGTDIVLIIFSKISSRIPFLLAESGAALGMFREQGRPLLIPILIDDIELPSPLSQIKNIRALDRNVDKIVAEVIESLGKLVGNLKAREEQKHEVERHLDAYLGPVLEELHDKEAGFTRTARTWYRIALYVLVAGLLFAIFRAVQSALRPAESWMGIVQITIASLIVIGLLGALARFAFVLGKSFMVESLRNSNRRHAISYGQFYLRAFGDKALWSEIKDAFQFWNIDIGSSFLAQKPGDIDPQIFKTAVGIAYAIGGKIKPAGEKKLETPE